MSRAFFEAPARRDVCVELHEEALAEGETTSEVIGKLEASLYGTRDAPTNWQDEVKKSQGRYNPCMFHHPERCILSLVHGDDFVSAAGPEELKCMKAKLKERFEIKTIGGPQRGRW